uniref:Matrix-remodeling-associated protein 7 helical domain-containing protein n=1 Tax=Ciona savignyi TaxID=51511 RepID=H2YXS6_CIOSA
MTVWEILGDYLSFYGGINAVVLALLLILATQYMRKRTKLIQNESDEKKSSEDVNVSEPISAPEKPHKGEASISSKDARTPIIGCGISKKDCSTEIPSLARMCGYSPAHMKELSHCALFFQKFREEESESEKSPRLPKNPANTEESDGSLANPRENLEEQDDLDIGDLVVEDIDIEDENDECDISAEAMADIEAEMMDSSILMAPTSEEDNSSKDEGNSVKCDSNKDLEKQEDQKFTISSYKSSFNALQEATAKLTTDEVIEERRIQEEQLSNILAVMQQNPEMFGEMSNDEVNTQVNLYCI